jgi:hypothetical protein
MTMINALAATENGGSQRHDHADDPRLPGDLPASMTAGDHPCRKIGQPIALARASAILSLLAPRTLGVTGVA